MVGTMLFQPAAAFRQGARPLHNCARCLSCAPGPWSSVAQLPYTPEGRHQIEGAGSTVESRRASASSMVCW